MEISNTNPFLFIEHDITNQISLNLAQEFLENPDHGFHKPRDVDAIANDPRIDPTTEVILSDTGIPSDLSYEQLLNLPTWIAMPIFTTHISLKWHPKFGGFERELVELGPWTSVNSLEEYEDVLNTMRQAAEGDDRDISNNAHSDRFLADLSTLVKLNHVLPENTPPFLLGAVEGEINQAVFSYSWTLVNDQIDFPQDVIDRNNDWADRVVNFIQGQQENMTPLLIVVGEGHLRNYGGNSFLSILQNKLNEEENEDNKVATVTRFSENDWTDNLVD